MNRISRFNRVLLLITFLLSSCAQPAVQDLENGDTIPVSHVFLSDNQQLWDAASIVLADSESLESADEGTGVITTKYRRIDSANLDREITGNGTRNFNYRYRIQLQPQGENETELIVDVDVQTVYWGVYPIIERNPVLENKFRKELFTKVCKKIYPGNIAQCNVFPLKNPVRTEEPAKPRVSEQEATDNRIAELQKKLQVLGYDPGMLDGIWGRKTRDALIAFQKDHSLALTSPWQQETYQALADVLAKKARASSESGNQILQGGKFPAKAKVFRSTFLMRTPSILADSLVEIPQGTVIELQQKKGDFFLVAYRGHKGYVYSGLVEKVVFSSGDPEANYFTR